MDDTRIRELFEQFCGRGRYEKFLTEFNRQGRTDGRLLSWQEEQLYCFEMEQNLTIDRSIDRLIDLFGFCPVHRRRLEMGQARILYGLFKPDRDWREQLARHPFANTHILGGCMIEDREEAMVLFCQDCRDVEEGSQRRRGR